MDKQCLAELILQMGTDLEYTTKNIKFLLRQNPEKARDNPFKSFCQKYIEKLSHFANI
jgi:hypothetical protein